MATVSLTRWNNCPPNDVGEYLARPSSSRRSPHAVAARRIPAESIQQLRHCPSSVREKAARDGSYRRPVSIQLGHVGYTESDPVPNNDDKDCRYSLGRRLGNWHCKESVHGGLEGDSTVQYSALPDVRTLFPAFIGP